MLNNLNRTIRANKMGLSRLNNFLKNPKGDIIYVDPSNIDATDSIENQGNSLTRPFKTIQRALLEVARFSYQRGPNNDRFGRTTVMVYPGEHIVDNRPGFIPINDAPVSGNNYLTRAGSYTNNFSQFDLNTNFDISTNDNALYKLNSIHGGVIIPRGCSIVGLDLRKTVIRPLYIPNPENDQIERSAIFRVTGASYFWQFTIFDANPSGQIYKDYTTNTFIPNFSHHKLTAFEYADGVNAVEIADDFISSFSTTRTDLEMYYEKVGLAFGASSGRPITPDFGAGTVDIEPKIDEYRIVGSVGDTVGITSIKAGDGVNSTSTVTVTFGSANQNFQVDSPITIAGVNAAGYNGNFVISEVVNTTQVKYRVQNPPSNALPTIVSGVPTITAVVDTVSSASPYIFNISLRSVYGMCGLHADGDKATGFKSMVVAQFTGIGLQKDPNAFVKYDSASGTYLDRTASGNENISSDSRARYKPAYENFHIKASNDSILQLVSIFAIGYANHFVVETGGDLSLTNSNSNFGAKSLYATGFKRNAFVKDDVGYVTHIIPPRELETDDITIEFLGIDVGVTTSIGDNTRVYLYDQNTFDNPPSHVIQGYRFGAKSDDRLNATLITTENTYEISAPILMQNTPGTGAEATSKKVFTVALTASNQNNIENNIITLNTGHTLKTGENVRILSNNGSLPDGIIFNSIYYVITNEVSPSLGVNQIKLAQTINEAINDTPLDINNRGGLLTIESRVSDKAPGDLGHPIQWDSSAGQWYVNVSSDPLKNNINETLNAYGVGKLGVTTPKTFLYRRPDPRPLSDKIFRVRYVVPKDSPIKGRPPLDGYIIQESNGTIPSTNAEVAKYYSPNFAELSNSTELRNPRFISGAVWSPANGGIAIIFTELPHDLALGSEVEISNIASINNLTAADDLGFNGKFIVVSVLSRKSFVVLLPTDPGAFATNTSQRTVNLPAFKRTKYYSTYVIYRVEEVQEYIPNEKDGIYYLIVINSGNTPSPSPFNTLKFLQPVQYLYPQTNRDNPVSDPLPTVSHALPDPIGQVVVNDPERSITKESLGRALLDFGVGVGITNIISKFEGASISQYKHTIYTRLDHGLNRLVEVSIISGGLGYGFGSAAALYNAPLVGIAGTFGDGATAAVKVDASGTITGIAIMDGGSAYSVGDTLTVANVGVVTFAPWVPAILQVSKIYDNIGETISVQGIYPPIYDGYNALYEVVGLSTGKTKEIEVYSATPVSAATTTGLGATFTAFSALQYNAPTIKVQSFTYNNVTGIVTVTCPDNHGLFVDNKVRLGGFDNDFFNKDYIVKRINSLTSFNIRPGISTVAISTAGTPKIYRGGFGANGGALTKTGDRISARIVTEYAGIVTTLGASIVDSATDTVVINNVSNFDFRLGDYFTVDDEIFRIKSAPGIGSAISNPVAVFRGLFGSQRQPHVIGSAVRRIKVRPSELRRHSIIRASGHTFEYVGYGPGNYSTALPDKQDRQLKPAEELIAQSTRVDGGINVFTGMNNDGDFYIGNKRVSSATGQEEIFDAPVPTVTGEDIGVNLGGLNLGFDLINPLEANVQRSLRVDGGSDNNAISEFSGPVVFNNKIISNTDRGVQVKSLLLQGESDTTQKISVGISTPTTAGDYGDVTFADNPVSGQTIGWVYTINNTWERWGPIQNNGRFVGIWSGIDGVPSFFGDGSGLFNVSDIWKVDAVGIHTDRKVGIGTDSAKSGVSLYVRGDSEITGVTTVSNNTQSTTPANGAFIVKGGVGIGSNLNVGGDFRISGVSTFANDVYIQGSLDINGHTELDNLNVSGFSTFMGPVRFNDYVGMDTGLSVAGVVTFTDRFYYGKQEFKTYISGWTIVFGL
jgi:hypothetical protein